MAEPVSSSRTSTTPMSLLEVHFLLSASCRADPTESGLCLYQDHSDNTRSLGSIGYWKRLLSSPLDSLCSTSCAYLLYFHFKALAIIHALEALDGLNEAEASLLSLFCPRSLAKSIVTEFLFINRLSLAALPQRRF